MLDSTGKYIFLKVLYLALLEMSVPQRAYIAQAIQLKIEPYEENNHNIKSF